MEYNIYCDESCHIEHDGNDIFVVGGVMCPYDNASVINSDILDMKRKFGFKAESEIKWSKISPANVDFYLALIDYFFKSQSLCFRGYVGRGKSELNHKAYNQSYDDWYYKMYYRMLEFWLDSNRRDTYFIYLDIKDTLGGKKVSKLRNYFNSHYKRDIANRVQLVRSDEIAVIQLADVLIGALSYKHRGLQSSSAKQAVISRIEESVGHSMLLSCSYSKRKANWFIWVPDTWR